MFSSLRRAGCSGALYPPCIKHCNMEKSRDSVYREREAKSAEHVEILAFKGQLRRKLETSAILTRAS